jgi:pimeloyl-ACP methyl ester carboxylesterase
LTTTFAVDVGGATPLAVAAYGAGPDSGAPIVVAVHGITSNGQVWAVVASALGDDVCLLAPDLRGRGASRDVGAPYGIRQHAADVAAVLDHIGVAHALLVGHSMGAWVVATLAATQPHRARGVVLVDGGAPAPAVEVDDPGGLIEAVLGPAMTRLTMTFPSREAYHEFWRAHPAFTPANGVADADLVAYADADLVGDPPELRSSVRADAVRADGAETFLDGGITGVADGIACPTILLRAPRGLLDDDKPLVPLENARAFAADHDDVRLVEVDDVNHYSIVFAPHGVAAVVAAIGSLT